MHSRKHKRRKADTAELAAQLAPLEELDKRIAAKQFGSEHNSLDPRIDPHYGAIIVDNDNLNLPKDITEERDEKRVLRMEPVVLVILSIMLIFIAFIAWQISLLPEK